MFSSTRARKTHDTAAAAATISSNALQVQVYAAFKPNRNQLPARAQLCNALYWFIRTQQQQQQQLAHKMRNCISFLAKAKPVNWANA